MLIRHISIDNFRGIKSLDWHVDGWLICLIGPGDSTKTTILDAIELALLPRWNIPFSDADFYKADTTSPIRIQVTLGHLTDDLLSEDRCGLFLRGYKPFKPFNDDPDDGWEPVVTLRLRVGDDLEPHWELVKDAVNEAKQLSWRDRERFCMARLGNDVERHLTWSRGSALARITENASDANSMLALVNRAANEAIFSTSQKELASAAYRAKTAAKRFGVQLPDLSAGLDTRSQGFGTGALSLHDSSRVPVRATGLGSRRLTGLAIQHEGLGADSILLIDEIEHGLEPHRIRRLIKRLCEDRLPDAKSKEQPVAKGQVITTTHSPTPIMSLDVKSLRFVRSKNGVTSVTHVHGSQVEALQPIARTYSHAFLARKIVVCEGKTEEAMLRGLDDLWEKLHDGSSFATCGVVPINGGGRSSGPPIAIEFRRLGYDVTFLGDSDEPLSVSASEMENLGITVSLWPGNMATEERVCTDIPLIALQQFLTIATERFTEATVRESLKKQLGTALPKCELQIDTLIANGLSEEVLRREMGKAAKPKGGEWFKDITTGELLGGVIAAHLAEIPSSPLAKTLSVLEGWVYAE